MEAAHISPELPIRWVVSADRTVEIKEEVTELGCDQANERILQEETPPSSITERDPKESHAVPKCEAQEEPWIESVYKQEESFDQEWWSSLKQVTELTCVKDEEVPRLECVPIKEEFLEQECVPIAEEVPTENNVCTLEENNKLGSSLCDDCPPECELGFRDPKESRAVPESEAQEGLKIESVYTLEKSFDQEWCASLKQVTEMTCVKVEEVLQLDCVPIKEEFIEQECVPIAEEVPTENNVCTLEENNQLGSNLCDDCPPECELGFRASGLLWHQFFTQEIW
ncbi:UNVERIFIED_CONTAM: hypothetical protein FKN15_053352 [Acipenser sinensis]